MTFMRKDSVAREVFGDEFVDHFGGTREHEVRLWEEAVTDWFVSPNTSPARGYSKRELTWDLQGGETVYRNGLEHFPVGEQNVCC